MKEKIKISQGAEINEVWVCDRCNKHYCTDCVDFKEVDFSIEENINEEKDWLPVRLWDWSGVEVCPWCYNQLVDKFNEKEKGEK